MLGPLARARKGVCGNLRIGIRRIRRIPLDSLFLDDEDTNSPAAPEGPSFTWGTPNGIESAGLFYLGLFFESSKSCSVGVNFQWR